MSSKFHFLYLKIHNKTGLKYLGKTNRNPFRYKGSGLHWVRHLKEHGNDVSTAIIGAYQSLSDLQKFGLYYSNLWDIVESKEWANIKPELGDGAGNGSANRGNSNIGGWNRGLTKTTDPRVAINAMKVSEALKGIKFTEKHKKNMRKPHKKKVRGFAVAKETSRNSDTSRVLSR